MFGYNLAISNFIDSLVILDLGSLAPQSVNLAGIHLGYMIDDGPSLGGKVTRIFLVLVL
jgi:hypothetical protein